jgi:hypothetical protein
MCLAYQNGPLPVHPSCWKVWFWFLHHNLWCHLLDLKKNNIKLLISVPPQSPEHGSFRIAHQIQYMILPYIVYREKTGKTARIYWKIVKFRMHFVRQWDHETRIKQKWHLQKRNWFASQILRAVKRIEAMKINKYLHSGDFFMVSHRSTHDSGIKRTPVLLFNQEACQVATPVDATITCLRHTLCRCAHDASVASVTHSTSGCVERGLPMHGAWFEH